MVGALLERVGLTLEIAGLVVKTLARPRIRADLLIDVVDAIYRVAGYETSRVCHLDEGIAPVIGVSRDTEVRVLDLLQAIQLVISAVGIAVQGINDQAHVALVIVVVLGGRVVSAYLQRQAVRAGIYAAALLDQGFCPMKHLL